MKRLLLLSVLTLHPTLLMGQWLAPFNSLHCVEVGGAMAAWEGFGSVTTSESEERNSYVIGSVDLTRGTAQLTGDKGSKTVRAVPLEESMTFIEMPFSGDQAFTTVFYPTREQDFYFFVRSRHTTPGAPVVIQSHGFCRVLS